MSDGRFSFPACVIAGKRRLDVDDLLMLRKHAFSDGIRTEEDVHLLLAIHRACDSSCTEWDCYLVESIAAYAVHGQKPRGWLDEANAEWLIATLSVNGVVATSLELEILLHALDIASSAPECLSAFMLDQMRLGLNRNAGSAYSLSRPNSHPGVDIDDLHYLWRVLRSACDNGRLTLSPRERDVLVAIDAMAEPRVHHAGWNALADTLQLRLATPHPGPRAPWLRASPDALLDSAHQAA
ncbi:hypothetical protein ACQKKX_17990 [Neorhizobium sp. NPDC001467]|uniref:hypothetical protein n=1 Tax=Neorhizobium sp. NPDC001467 TaxID=3390595 RepID=UPI003D022B54